VRPLERSGEAHENELQEECMKLYVLPPSPRALKVIALKNHLGLDCALQVVDLGNDEHRSAEFTALNPCCAAVLNGHLRGRQWLSGAELAIADFAVGAWLAVAHPFPLPVAPYPEILRWYEGLAALPAWQAS
jgi:glutathione S-transferase